MAYTFDEPRVGLLQIANTDSGFVPPNQATAIPTPPNVLGMIVRAFDPVYGEGEFILLPGIANTTVGSVVTYNATTYATTLSANTAGAGQPLAVAMSANIVATTFGWYQIGGLAVIKKTAVKVNPQVAIFQSATTGRIMPTTASGKEILGAKTANLATIASATSTVIVLINRPHSITAVT